MTLLTLRDFYGLVGVVIGIVAVGIAREPAHPRRATSALFWGLLAALYLFGDLLPRRLVGTIVVGLMVLGAMRLVRGPRPAVPDFGRRRASAARLGNKLFLLPLIVPSGAVLGSLLLPHLSLTGVGLVDPKQASVIAVALSALVAIAATLRATGDRAGAPLREGGRILETFGWVVLLPQVLAALGGVLVQVGLGDLVGALVGGLLPAGSAFAAVTDYCVGMAALTGCLGNAFAAFAVATAGIGLPLIVRAHHGDPAIMAALGMLSGYCGTLLTPMAANFNLVPALLLDLPRRNSVIKAQAPVAFLVLAANIVLMGACVYRF